MRWVVGIAPRNFVWASPILRIPNKNSDVTYNYEFLHHVPIFNNRVWLMTPFAGLLSRNSSCTSQQIQWKETVISVAFSSQLSKAPFCFLLNSVTISRNQKVCNLCRDSSRGQNPSHYTITVTRLSPLNFVFNWLAVNLRLEFCCCCCCFFRFFLFNSVSVIS